MRTALPGPALYATAALILGVACSQSDPATPEASPREPAAARTREPSGPTVAFLGDSLAAGLHLAADEAFPAVLERELARRGAPFRLVNAGVSGDTTAGGLRRVDWLLQQAPEILVIELGGNDGLRGIDLETIEANLRAMAEAARDAGATVLLLGQVMPPNYGAEYTAGFAALYDRVAADLGLAYVPYFLEGVGGVPEMNLPDGLHPTAEGHRKIAERLAPTLEGLVRAETEAAEPDGSAPAGAAPGE